MELSKALRKVPLPTRKAVGTQTLLTAEGMQQQETASASDADAAREAELQAAQAASALALWQSKAEVAQSEA